MAVSEIKWESVQEWELQLDWDKDVDSGLMFDL